MPLIPTAPGLGGPPGLGALTPDLLRRLELMALLQMLTQAQPVRPPEPSPEVGGELVGY